MMGRLNHLRGMDADWAEDLADWASMPFYHGTSRALPISRLLPPAETGVLREAWRTRLTDKVFFTDSLCSARKYAKKACETFGGDPVVYVIRPVGAIWHLRTTEYVADAAEILGTEDPSL